jgi:hypothetical protein
MEQNYCFDLQQFKINHSRLIEKAHKRYNRDHRIWKQKVNRIARILERDRHHLEDIRQDNSQNKTSRMSISKLQQGLRLVLHLSPT